MVIVMEVSMETKGIKIETKHNLCQQKKPKHKICIIK